MNDAGYIFAGYFSTFAILAGYAGWVIRRKRTLSRLLRPEDRRSKPPPSRSNPAMRPEAPVKFYVAFRAFPRFLGPGDELRRKGGSVTNHRGRKLLVTRPFLASRLSFPRAEQN